MESKRFISYGSIEQFRNTIKSINHNARFIGFDKKTRTLTMNEEEDFLLPKVTATCSEKIHGTNAAVCYSAVDGFWVQSRSRIIALGKDNAGCAAAAYKNEEEWMKIIHALAAEYHIDLDQNVISLYFEWAGGDIQRHSALTGMTKKSIIFQHFKVSPIALLLLPDVDDDDYGEGEEKKLTVQWYETKVDNSLLSTKTSWVDSPSVDIYNIMNYSVWVCEIDFNQPLLSQTEMMKIVMEDIQPNSPVGKEMGTNNNVGEGLVATFMYKGDLYKFKVKGELHAKSDTKVKVLPPVDEGKEQSKIDFVNKHACKAFRLEQAWQTVFGIANEKKTPSMKSTAAFIKAVNDDVVKEESDILTEMGLNLKEVKGMIQKVARDWFIGEIKRLNNKTKT